MQDLTGQIFGRWRVIRATGKSGYETVWLCRCECGNQRELRGIVLRHGKSKSCGCLKREVTIKRSTKHGHATGGIISPTYHTWAGMIARCTNPKHKDFHSYGGRGIAIDPRWMEFSAFLQDMGEKPKGASIERVDNDGDYQKANCTWASQAQQARNKSTNRQMTLYGRTQTLAAWADELKIHPATLSDRKQHGWSDDAALRMAAGSPNDNVRTRLIVIEDEVLSVAEWCRKLGLKSGTVYQRLHRGWSVLRALGLTQ